MHTCTYRYERLLETSQLQHELLKCVKELSLMLDEGSITTYIQRWLRANVNVDRVTVYFVDRQAQQLWFRIPSDREPSTRSGDRSGERTREVYLHRNVSSAGKRQKISSDGWVHRIRVCGF